MRHFVGYIRVSTVKQGEKGVSLQEQKAAIERYAKRSSIAIRQWFEERETAAKCGRPIFKEMLKLLLKGKAHGVVMHKVDRGARNFRDWADLQELLDRNVEVRFANEDLDMRSRGGRLAADIQAVIATDYIRNLREEIKKGFYGRLKQGVFPLPAPMGYLNMGKGKPKEPDPAKAPLIQKAFTLYATGVYSLDTLRAHLAELGLKSRSGSVLARNTLNDILKNPFYIGLMRIKKTRELFEGAHRPLISKVLFDRVQEVMSGKWHPRKRKHQFLFAKLLTCRGCRRSLYGERQKGHIYYRCHNTSCRKVCVRKEKVEAAITEALALLRFTEEEAQYVKACLATLAQRWGNEQMKYVQALKLQSGKLQDRLNRLTDAFLDGSIEQELFNQRKAALLVERKDVAEKLTNAERRSTSGEEGLARVFELATSAYQSYKLATHEEKRELLKTIFSNRWVEGKNVSVELRLPFSEIAKRARVQCGGPQRDVARTLDAVVENIFEQCRNSTTYSELCLNSLPT